MRSRLREGQRVSVIGAGRSGRAVATLLREHGLDVLVSERASLGSDVVQSIEATGARVETGGHSQAVLDVDFLVTSPGVPESAEPIRNARQRGLPVYSEIEVASWYCEAPIVAVTGSNGKTTTTSLIGSIFHKAQRPVEVAGNIGLPFSAVVDRLDPDATAVLEISSFQLDTIEAFRPRVALLLNITPDHLDRYDSFDHYVSSKLRIAENQGAGDTLIYGLDDPVLRSVLPGGVAGRGIRILTFSTDTEPDEGAFLRDGLLVLRINSAEEPLMQAEELALRGQHNVRNALAAALAARVMEIRSDVIRESLMTFEGVPHRLEFVRELDGVRYVNDSKATNVNAVWYALESFRRPIVLIAGGRDKGNDYSEIADIVRSRVCALIGIGESGDRVVGALGPKVPFSRRVFTMEEAVELARAVASPGDVVLLSPACASFDMFENFEERGDTFRRLVNDL